MAALVVVLFLGNLGVSVTAFLAIPLSILACCIGLYLSGDAINVMTLAGMALSVGPLIDNSIVVLENIMRHRERGQSFAEVALTATTEIAMPVLAATLALIIIFLPVVFLTGIGKFLFTPLAKSVSFSVLASYLISVTVIPLYCVGVLGRMAQKPHTHVSGQRFQHFATWYEGTLRRLLPHRMGVIGVCVGLFLASLLLYPWLGKELFPRADVGHLTVHLSLPTGMRIEQTEQILAHFEQRLPEAIEPTALQTVITNIGVLYDWPARIPPTPARMTPSLRWS
ncbi:MAG: efflux RND transporter permease subunit [Candidatus Omnitrophica bacterium]|nr:efflux RND transporter permease subunit [Candidatus Omnitrophota bacterium]